MTVEPEIDKEKADAFAGQILSYVNGTAVTFMISLAHQTGLLDTMAEMPPSTSEEIAAKAGLNERYVRECLGGLVMGDVVEYEPGARRYSLPPEHAAYLTRAAGTNNLGVMCMYFPEFGKIEQQLVSCFREGGGVPYSEFKRFHAIMREDSAQVFDNTLIDGILPLVPGLVDRLKEGIAVADVGCGSGHAINLMAKAFPASRFAGIDISEEALAHGRQEAEQWGLTNARFEMKDAAQLDLRDEFDVVTTIDAVHDQAQPAAVLDGIYRALKPGGTYLCVDVAASSNLEENKEHMLGPFLYAVSTLHCMTVSLAYDGVGLGTAWGEQKALQMLGEAGFKDIEVKQVEGDLFNNYYIAKK